MMVRQVTPEKYRLPETKDAFREFLKGMEPTTLVDPESRMDCFLCRFVRKQLAGQKVEFVLFDTKSYKIAKEYAIDVKHHELPGWAERFTRGAFEVSTSRQIWNNAWYPGGMIPAQALAVLEGIE